MDACIRQQPARSRVLLASLLVLASAMSTSCALVVHGRTQVLTEIADPAGARVYVGTQLMGATPAQILVRRSRKDAVLRIKKDGYDAWAESVVAN